jgi:AcrR family transcriptional regulator
LQRAGDIASVEGLEGLTIGRLAGDLNVSKSGLFAHFGSKEQLQLATITAAIEVFTDRVINPAVSAERGVRRVWALCESWLDYSRARVFPGGCFFYGVGAEFDARPGSVRDAMAAARKNWLELFERTVIDACRLGELASDTDPAQLVFELDALAAAANGRAQLLDDDDAYRRARIAMFERLRSPENADLLPPPRRGARVTSRAGAAPAVRKPVQRRQTALRKQTG